MRNQKNPPIKLRSVRDRCAILHKLHICPSTSLPHWETEGDFCIFVSGEHFLRADRKSEKKKIEDVCCPMPSWLRYLRGGSTVSLSVLPCLPNLKSSNVTSGVEINFLSVGHSTDRDHRLRKVSCQPPRQTTASPTTLPTHRPDIHPANHLPTICLANRSANRLANSLPPNRLAKQPSCQPPGHPSCQLFVLSIQHPSFQRTIHPTNSGRSVQPTVLLITRLTHHPANPTSNPPTCQPPCQLIVQLTILLTARLTHRPANLPVCDLGWTGTSSVQILSAVPPFPQMHKGPLALGLLV
jgi:hypothetical protein